MSKSTFKQQLLAMLKECAIATLIVSVCIAAGELTMFYILIKSLDPVTFWSLWVLLPAIVVGVLIGAVILAVIQKIFFKTK